MAEMQMAHLGSRLTGPVLGGVSWEGSTFEMTTADWSV